MRRLQTLPLLSALALSVVPARAAVDAPGFFVSPSECQESSPECKCADAPMMELFLKNQQAALAAWRDTMSAILMPGGPSTRAEALDDFHMRFGGDERITNQFGSCSTFNDEMDRTATKVAGVDPTRGGAVLDPCFCETFCDDITSATANHERTHFAYGVLALNELIQTTVPCKAGLLDEHYCATIDAQQLAETEIFAHQVGNSSLQSSLDALKASDPDMPDMECTWEPLPAVALRVLPAPPPAPTGLWDRVELLASRFVHGKSAGAR
jgi:hypothetical protein